MQEILLVYLQKMCLHLSELDEKDDAEEDEGNDHHPESNYHRCAWLGGMPDTMRADISLNLNFYNRGRGLLALIVPTGKHSQE